MNHIISLGAGVQSTTVLLMACHGEITPKPKYAIFADTGWEPKETYRHVEWLKMETEKYGIELVETTKGNIMNDLMQAAVNQTRSPNMPFYTGGGGIVPRQCTSEYKIAAVNQKLRELYGLKKGSRVPLNTFTKWMGISTDEIYRVKKGQFPWETLRYPLIEKGMNRLDCMNWLTRKGYHVPPKSSCIGCPYHSDRTWLEMKRKDPDAFNEAVEFEKVIQLHGLRSMRRKVYLHKSCRPLGEIDFGEDQLEMDLFDNECEGVCGV